MSFQVTVEPLGEVLEVEEGQSILDAALRAGMALPYACNHGLCGTCKVDLLEGEVDHGEASAFALMDVERDEGKCLACCARPRSDLVIEADVEEEPDAQRHPIGDYTARVVEIGALTPTVKRVRLEPDRPLLFQAGQYINLKVPGEEIPRAFSLANDPRDPLLELQVRIVPGGKGTAWIHERLQPGDSVALSGPLGRFFVRGSIPGQRLFLAGGSGLSSPKSMVLDLLATEDGEAIELIHGVRTPDELYDDTLFRGLADAHPRFTYTPAVSEAAGGQWSGELGMVHEVAERRFDGRFAELVAYLCGPPPMIDACLTTLMRGRLFEERIFSESFYTAADADRPPKRSALFKKF
ncbi:MAG: 2Fe-2S iron-sulfur cluster binding domain-containing protein [Myxococcales bacterium]|nr:2Fe-2S iron-sulfur cluster binding domain-containing protein [Myxococcales bacterium]